MGIDSTTFEIKWESEMQEKTLQEWEGEIETLVSFIM